MFNKVTYNLFLITLCAYSFFATQRIKSFSVNTYLEKWYGHENVSDSTQELVTTIAKEMGITDAIIVKKMNANTYASYGWHNAIVLGNHVFISETFLHKLTPEEQRFLIGHELIHLRDKHVITLLILRGIALGLSAFGVYTSRRSGYSWAKTAALALGLVTATNIGCSYISRYNEKQADCLSVQMLHTAHDGISFLQKMQAISKEASVLYTMMYGTHPLLSQRIEYLQKYTA